MGRREGENGCRGEEKEKEDVGGRGGEGEKEDVGGRGGEGEKSEKEEGGITIFKFIQYRVGGGGGEKKSGR